MMPSNAASKIISEINNSRGMAKRSLGVGSEIVFAGGLMGRITKIDGDFAVVELSRGVDVKIQRASVISVLPEGTLNNL